MQKLVITLIPRYSSRLFVSSTNNWHNLFNLLDITSWRHIVMRFSMSANVENWKIIMIWWILFERNGELGGEKREMRMKINFYSTRLGRFVGFKWIIQISFDNVSIFRNRDSYKLKANTNNYNWMSIGHNSSIYSWCSM